MGVYCGIDWAEGHHDIAVVDDTGTLLAKRRISDDPAGLAVLLQVLAECGDGREEPVPVAIETARGLLVAALRASGRSVYAINPFSASRYRDRHSASGRKSDHGDAMVLANVLRTDRAGHRPLPDDSELAQAITVLARAQQDAVWDRQQLANRLRSLLKDYFPAALVAFQGRRSGRAEPEARAVLTAAASPAQAARLTRPQLRRLLIRAGRQRYVEFEVARLREALRADALHHPDLVEQAMGRHALALLGQLDAACQAVGALTAATEEHFARHPYAEIITSFPGLGIVNGARLLGEIGDDPDRFADPTALKAYAGAAPVTRASGRSRAVLHRRVKNQRLASVGYQWAFATLIPSPGARAHYDRRRTRGDRHNAALRHLHNRLLGCLHHCLQQGQRYDEPQAFGHLPPTTSRQDSLEPPAPCATLRPDSPVPDAAD